MNPQPQAFLSYNSADKDFVRHVATKLEAAGVQLWFDEWALRPGDETQRRIEEGLGASSYYVVFVGSAGLGKWQEKELRVAINREVSKRDLRVIAALLPGSMPDDLPGFLTGFRVAFTSHDDGFTIDRLIRTIQGRPLRDRPTNWQVQNPYRGLEVFDVQDADLFCGREMVTDWLLSMLRKTLAKRRPRSFLAIVGASGSGKSSLARAGVLAAIKRGEIEYSQDWLITICKPGQRPLESLAIALQQTPGIKLGEGLAATIVEKFIQELGSSTETLRRTSFSSLPQAGRPARHVVLVDQFEEIYTECKDLQQRQAFIDNLLSAGLDSDGKIITLITMRADFYEACAAHRSLAEAISASQYLLGPLNRDELRQSIENPALFCGGTVDPELTMSLLHEMEHEELALPLLQHALKQLWTDVPEPKLSMEKYREMQGLRGALQRHADGVFEQLSSAEQAVCREVLVELVNVSDPTRETRRRILKADLRARSKQSCLVDEVVEKLIDERLVTSTDRNQMNESGQPDAIVEVVHEALIRGWPKLKVWVDENRQERRLWQQFQQRVGDWSDFSGPTAQKEELLYSGSLLRQAVSWVTNSTFPLTHEEDEFLTASVSQLVDKLSKIKLQDLAKTLQELEPFLERARVRLVELFQSSPLNSTEQMVASLALLPIDPQQVEFLLRRLLSGPLEEFPLICDQLQNGKGGDVTERVTAWLWRELESATAVGPSAVGTGSPVVSAEQRSFRAGMGLGRFAPPLASDAGLLARWKPQVAKIANHLVAELSYNPANYEILVRLLEPLGRLLIGPLVDLARQQADAQRRSWATKLVSHFGCEEPGTLFDLACDVADERYGVLLESMPQHRSVVVAAAENELRIVLPSGSDWTERDRLAQRQANAAVTLLRLDATTAVWPLWQHTPDPSRRSWLIHRVGPLGVDPLLLAERLPHESDVSAQRALILALGEQITWEKLLTLNNGETARSTLNLLQRWYREHPDAGIHGAAAWTLRRWGYAEPLPPHTKPNCGSGPVIGLPSWEVNGAGQTLVVIPGPVEFLMGSPTHEAGRFGGPRDCTEQQHLKRIGRSFALAAHPVTVAEFQEFRADHACNQSISPTAQHPMNRVSWYDAAAYCNWLSKREGIDKAEWCYDPKRPFTEGMRIPRDFLNRTGYRLPTESEWEYACRADSVSRYYFGESDKLLTRYVWYSRSSDDEIMRAVGELKPNDWGLSDMLGNVLEWCHDTVRDYFVQSKNRAINDVINTEKLDDRIGRILRGGSFQTPASGVRAAYRGFDQPVDRATNLGFRLARTYR